MLHRVPRMAPAAAAIALALAAGSGMAQEGAAPAAGERDPSVLTAELMPRAARSVLLDMVATGDGLVAVGERGHVLRSTDGEAWEQVAGVPTRSTLTTVTALGERLWAAGHDGVILASGDGGATWERQRAAPWAPGVFEPGNGGPILDLLFLDAERGFAIGAYSMLLTTVDGGATWEATTLVAEADDAADAPAPEAEADDAFAAGDDWTFSDDDLALETESDPHLNAIARTGSGALVIAGERGAFFRSRDEGATWERLALPYEGSMFGVLGGEGEHVVVFGLRGNAFESHDLGATWAPLGELGPNGLFGGAFAPDGAVVLVGVNGAIVRRGPDGAPVESTYRTAEGETPTMTAAHVREDGRVVVIGDRGVGLHQPE